MDRRPTLEIYEPEARFVRMMYQLYTQATAASPSPARQRPGGQAPPLGGVHPKQRGPHPPQPHLCRESGLEPEVPRPQGAKGNPKHITIYNPREKWTIVDGLHPAIVSQELYDTVQDIMAGRYIPSKNDGTVRSSLAGLVKCANCGQNMQRMVMRGQPYLLCMKKGCCSSTKFELVEQRVLSYLEETLVKLELEQQRGTARDTSVLDSSLEAVKKELAAAQRQKSRLYELLEMEEYDLPTFRERMAAVKEKIAGLERRQRETEQSIRDAQLANPAALARKIRAVLDAYDAADAAGRNAMLKGVISTITYQKDKKSKQSEFQLRFTLKPY